MEKYGTTEWDALSQVIRDIIVDLRYRGDYTGSTRQKVQPVIVANSVARLKTLMRNNAFWRDTVGVPANRFRRRVEFIER